MVDEEVFVDKLRYCNQYTAELKQMRGLTRDAYENDLIRQRAVERTLMNLIQVCIDLARHIRSSERLSSSGTAKNEIEALGEADIISSAVQAKLEEAAGFRNILAHRYGDVDHDIVYDVLHDDLEWFERFQQQLAQWYQETNS